jgi:hypothetical protein
LVYFTNKLPFGGHLLYPFFLGVCCTDKNLATLVTRYADADAAFHFVPEAQAQFVRDGADRHRHSVHM